MEKTMNPVRISSNVGTIFLGIGGVFLATKTLSYFAAIDFQNEPNLQALSANFTSIGLTAVVIGLSALFTNFMLKRKLAKKLHSILEDE